MWIRSIDSEQLKNLKPGNAIAFGSAFKVPISLYIDIPNPRPLSNNVDLENVWYKEQAPASTAPVAPQAANDVNAAMAQQAQNATFVAPVASPGAAQPAAQAQAPATTATQAAVQNFTQQANATNIVSTVGNVNVAAAPSV